ncbi:hypothetical protein Achl_4237 (plasmid) [Pseudarthrobacter chlorophenolicus A6]|uniref:Uncharacterized protein n=1 Tax=Pseudarthrobacter chlorophenolicus (strain ATCC 700700 / DSM 12829 / CIP 107037 / JCM 12360 / KCTC 9906 / NCIMB 13794 / A6) TaxID=452863 RepID=B8HIE1_PSECP|nr:hypothetical protein Achl_4237 [Pseudarthrobacter chlorophenolicus A6]SDQ14595.1 hypothetical protein SAMN04489738_0295 [Pseudarthrobacter chlorophenolicus]
MCGLRALVDACGADGGAPRFSFRCSALRDELLRNGSSAWTNRSASSFLHCEASSAERRCPLRSPTREHSVHGTAAKPQRNRQLSITGDVPLTARRRRHRPRNKTPQEGPPARGEALRNTPASAAATRSRWRSHRGEHIELRDEPRHGRRTADGPPQATPTVEQGTDGNKPPARGAAPVIMMIYMTMKHRTAEPGKAQPPRSGDTTDKAAQRPGQRIEVRAGRRVENTTGRAQRGRGAQRSTDHRTKDNKQPRRKACRGARAAREQPAAGQETKRRSRRGETNRRAGRSANRETRRARGEAPSPLNMSVQPLPPPVCSTAVRIFHTGSTATAGPSQRTTYRRRGGWDAGAIAYLAVVLTYCPFSTLIMSPVRNLRQSALRIDCLVIWPVSRLMETKHLVCVSPMSITSATPL